MGAKNARTGGKGSMRRKKKAVHKSASGSDNKKISAMIKRLGCQPLQQIEQVNMFRDDGKVIHFANPKVQGSHSSSAYVISGHSEVKDLTELMPGIIAQLGQEMLTQMTQNFNPEMLKNAQSKLSQNATADDEPPALVENFEEVAKEEKTE